jgi:hypothetical protein
MSGGDRVNIKKMIMKGKNCATKFIFTVAIILSLVLQGCSSFNRIIREDDIAYSTRRISLKYLLKDYDRRSPLLYVEQSVVKEIRDNNSVSYTAYDILHLNGSGFEVDNNIFFIVDDHAYQMQIDRRESDYSRTLSEETTDIQTSDSTSVTVATGYSFENSKITRFSYPVPLDVIKKINESNKMKLRYYSGPDMITVALRKRHLLKLKKLINE